VHYSWGHWEVVYESKLSLRGARRRQDALDGEMDLGLQMFRKKTIHLIPHRAGNLRKVKEVPQQYSLS